ncbi:LysR family transcriptional regulator [Moritella viscosa]
MKGDFSAIPVFVAVVENGSFSSAADKLGMTKSAVSKRISVLEDNIGVRLFNRTTRSITLTEAGERFSDYARMLLLWQTKVLLPCITCKAYLKAP